MGIRDVYAYIPEKETRKERKDRVMRERQLANQERVKVPNKDRRAGLEAVKKWGGRAVANSLWGPPTIACKPARASSLTIAGAYPFIADAGLGARGVWMGKMGVTANADFVFDPYELYNKGIISGTSMIVIGTVGTGKSACIKSLISRSVLHGIKAMIASDPKGEWAPVARALGGDVIALSATSTEVLNPLDEGPRDSALDNEQWTRRVASRRRTLVQSIVRTLLERPLQPAEWTVIDVAIATETARTQEPTLGGVYDAVLNPEGADKERMLAAGAAVGDALRRLVLGDLGGPFNGISTVKFNPDSPIVVLDTSGFLGSDERMLDIATLCTASWAEAAAADSKGGKRYMVYDEGYRMLRNPQQLLRMSDQWKLARQYGLANILIMHRLSDLDAIGDEGTASRELARGLLSDAEIRIVYRQKHDVLEQTMNELGLTREETQVVGQLPVGVGLWKVGNRPFIVSNILTADELSTFNTSSRFQAEDIQAA